MVLKRYIFTTCLFLTSFLSVIVAKSFEKEIMTSNRRIYYYNNYFMHFGKIASSANLWNGPMWSLMELEVYQYDDRFKTPQMFGNGNYIGFSTESAQRVDSLGYAFYGKFMYKTGRDFDSEYNQVYKLPDFGNPIYLFLPIKGKWETQEYYFKGLMSKVLIKNRIFAGASMSYSGNLYNRVIDTRNRQTNLSIQLSPSITYRINSKNSLSVGMDYLRAKYEPLNSNYMQRPGDDPNYWLYLNKGMGTYERINLGYGFYSVSNSYEISAQWSRITGFKKLLSARISYMSGNNNFKSKTNIPQTNDFFKLGKYEWSRAGVELALTSKVFGLDNLSNISFSYLKGDAFTFNDQQSLFQRSYKYSEKLTKAITSFFVNNKVFNHISAGIAYENKGATDMNYGHRYSYHNIVPEVIFNTLSLKFLKGIIST